MKHDSFSRYSLVGWGMTLAFIVIFAWIIRLQLGPERAALSDRKREQEKTIKTIYPERGNIYDRWGRLLAGNQEVYEIDVDLNQAIDKETIMTTLSEVLQMSAEDYQAMRSQLYPSTPPGPGRSYAVLAKFVETDKVAEIQKRSRELAEQAANQSRALFGGSTKPAPHLRYLEFSPMLKRSYPEGDLAANILGFYPYYNMKDAAGTFGLEQQYNAQLGGTPFDVMIENDPYAIKDTLEIPAGANLVTTIDREIQTMAEQVLDRAIESNGSEGGTILIMDPRTGEIIAMAVQPRMDLNQYWQYKQVYKVSDENPNGEPYNRAIGTTYEPGSVFKVLTMAAGLDSGVITPASTMNDTGVYMVSGVAITNWDNLGHGTVDMTECMRMSLNVCMSWIAEKIGPTRFYEYMHAFGIGTPTQIDLAGESAFPLDDTVSEGWAPLKLATNSFGQGVSATPIEMITAISAVANDGKMMAPHVIKAIIKDGIVEQIEPRVLGTPISAKTANELTEILANSIEEEGFQPGVEGYRIAGKTGTAEIPSPQGYVTNLTNASFVGWGPVDDPRFIIYVWFEKPKSDIWGSTVAAPVFKEVMSHLVILMDIPPDAVRRGLASQP